MKTFIVSLLLAFSAINAYADLEGAPFIPEIDKRFDALEQGNHLKTGSYPAGAADGHYVKQEIQATYDFAKQTGAVGNYDLKVGLPKNAIIQRTGIWSLTKPTTSASGTLAFTCQNGGNLLGATAAAGFASAGAAIDGVQSGAATAWSTVTAPCNIIATIGTGALSAGKVTIYVDYVVHQ